MYQTNEKYMTCDALGGWSTIGGCLRNPTSHAIRKKNQEEKRCDELLERTKPMKNTWLARLWDGGQPLGEVWGRPAEG